MSKIELVGFDSLGVRSMATVIHTYEGTIFIDPSASLAPRRFSLPPHEIEWKRLYEVVNDIEDKLRDADIVIITHYHYDHHDPGRLINIDLFKGKKVFLKDPKNNINISQRIRASRFLSLIGTRVASIDVADGNSVRIGKVSIKFSRPVPHGVDDKLGYVVMVCVSDGEDSLVFTSDVEGPVNNYVTKFIKECSPRVVIVDGPPTYLIGTNYPQEALARSIELNRELLRVNTIEYLILDHHLLRDMNYKSFYEAVKSLHKESLPRILTAAEFMGKEPILLESRRRELYGLNK